MSRFFFHILDGFSSPDVDGTLLTDLASAKLEAVRLSGAVLCENAARFWEGPWSLEVLDHRRALLFTLNFSATMAPAVA